LKRTRQAAWKHTDARQKKGACKDRRGGLYYAQKEVEKGKKKGVNVGRGKESKRWKKPGWNRNGVFKQKRTMKQELPEAEPPT